jgi:hypothetical protein
MAEENQGYQSLSHYKWDCKYHDFRPRPWESRFENYTQVLKKLIAEYKKS